MFHKGLIGQSKGKEKLEPTIDEQQLELHRLLIYQYEGATKDSRDNIMYKFKIIRPNYHITTDTKVENYESNSASKRKRVT